MFYKKWKNKKIKKKKKKKNNYKRENKKLKILQKRNKINVLLKMKIL